jgi:hypothetical protein
LLHATDLRIASRVVADIDEIDHGYTFAGIEDAGAPAMRIKPCMVGPRV